jgi:hypothetical protein
MSSAGSVCAITTRSDREAIQPMRRVVGTTRRDYLDEKFGLVLVWRIRGFVRAI